MAYPYTAYQVVHREFGVGFSDWRTTFATKKSGSWVEYAIATVALAGVAIANNGDDFIAITSGGGASVQLWQSHDQGETWSEEGTPPPFSQYAWNVGGVWFVYRGTATYYISGDLAVWSTKTLPANNASQYSPNQFCIGEDDIIHAISDPDGSDDCYYTKSADLDTWEASVKVLGNIAPVEGFYFWSAIACTNGHVIVATADNGGKDLVWNVSHDNGDTWEGEDSLTTPADTLDGQEMAVWISGEYAYMVYRGQLSGSGDIFRIWIYRSDDWNGAGAITWALLRADVWHEDIACATDATNGLGYAIETYPTVFTDPATIWLGKYRELFPVAETVIRTVLPDPRTGNPYVPTFGEQEIDTFYSPPFQLGYDRRSDAGAYTYFF